MASTKLRLLLEASVENPLADCIRKLVPAAPYVREIPTLKDADDDVIYRAAQAEERIIVDVDGDFKEGRYPPGPKNPGIIRFNSKREHPDALCEQFRLFYQSGFRKYAPHSFTYLTSKGARINRAEEKPIFYNFSSGAISPI